MIREIGWDCNANDIAVFGGDFLDIEDASIQNGTLILLKSAVNIFNCAVGTDLETYYPHMLQSEIDALSDEAEKQIKDDGAIYADVEVTRTDEGADVQVNCQY